MSSSSNTASAAMAQAAMPLEELDRWLRERTARLPAATSLPMLDGYVTAIVAGPVSLAPPDWICPLLAIDTDAFNHGGTPEFAAISAVALRHNTISDTLSTAPQRFEPIFRRKPSGGVDVRPWCQGFSAAMKLRLLAWAPLLDVDGDHHALLLPILLHCVDDQGHPLVQAADAAEVRQLRRRAHADIPVVVEGIRRYWMPIRYRTRA